MTRKTAPNRRRRKAPKPRPDFSPRWLERYGRSLTGDEIRLVQAHRGIAEAEQQVLRAYASHLVINRGKIEGAASVTYADRAEPREAGHIKLLDRRQFTWEMPGNIARRRISRDNGDTFITERAPANLHVDVMIDDDPKASERAFLWIGIADQNNPPGYNLCYAVIGGDALRQAAEKIVAAYNTRQARRARR